jgi:hypothetical protein
LNKFALILAHNRPSETQDVIDDIKDQVDYILVVDNASEPPMHTLLKKPITPLTFLRDMTQPANLPRLWNLGFDQILMIAEPSGRSPYSPMTCASRGLVRCGR